MVMLVLVGCTHTEPPTVADSISDGPFNHTQPIRLTWSELAEIEPGFSADGQWITYVFERDGDRDRCIGVLPARGGTRVRTLCAWELDEAGKRDGMSAPALHTDGRLLFTRQFGRMFVMPNDSSALYLAGAGSGDAPVKLASLPVNLPGSARSWPDLMAPVWISDNELLTLTAQRFPYWGLNCQFDCPHDWVRVPLIDTLKLGIEIARLRFDGSTPTLISTFPALHASAWAYDASTSMIYFVQRTVDPEDVTFMESTSDTLYRVPLGGGSREAVLGFDRMDPPEFTRIHGVAAGSGRVFVSASWPAVYDTNTVTVRPNTPLTGIIFELMPDGSRRTLPGATSHHWGNLAVSPDGRSLVAESVHTDGSSDLYLISTVQ